ncbi:MAG: hypothetical protein U0175_23655 [Caldilineaceae bacterium]
MQENNKETSKDSLAITREHFASVPPEPHPDYRAYLLRLWRSGADNNWRASLQSVRTGERHVFADMESLLDFLVDQARPHSEGGG